MAPAPITPHLFAILGALVEEKTGLHYGERDRDLFGAKVWQRAQEAGFESLLEYYYFLRYDPAGARELDTLIEHLVVGETYLFRELDQIRMLVDQIVGPRVAAGARVRIWSAACATGEEPLTLAMVLAHRRCLDRVELVGSDISAAALGVARKGRFGRRAVRVDPLPAEAADQVVVEPDGTVTVRPDLVARVEWRQVNLLDRDQVRALGTFDVILCRNVLIYFRDATIKNVIDTLSAALAPSGALFVGVAESLLRLSTPLVCEEQAGVFFYRRPRP